MVTFITNVRPVLEYIATMWNSRLKTQTKIRESRYVCSMTGHKKAFVSSRIASKRNERKERIFRQGLNKYLKNSMDGKKQKSGEPLQIDDW